jgi:hypothetical protein
MQNINESFQRQEFVNLSNAIYHFDAEFCANAEGMSAIGHYIRHDSKQVRLLYYSVN